MDIDIRKSIYIKYIQNKKRVVSTLFLYILFFMMSCEFQSPEKWQPPSFYTNLTFTLANSVFSFEELINDSTILQDSITDVIHLQYPITIEPKGFPDNIFDINMSSVDIDDLNMGINESIDLTPYLPGDTTIIPISFPFNLSDYAGCIPSNILDFFEFDIINQVLDIPSFSDIALFTIKSITADSGYWESNIVNNLPFEIDVNFSINNGNNILYSTDTSNIGDYNCSNLENCNISTSSKEITENDPEIVNLETDINIVIEAGVSVGQENNADCTAQIYICPTSETEYANPIACADICSNSNFDCITLDREGFEIREDITEGVELSLQYKWYNISDVVVDFSGVDSSINMDINIPSFEGIEIYKAKIDTASISSSNNKFFVDIVNHSSISIDFGINFLNIFTESMANNWDIFSDLIMIPSKDSIKKNIDFSEKMISNGNPNNSISNLSPIESINMELVYSMNALENETIMVENNIVSLGAEFDLSIEDIAIEYIGAIAESVEFPVAESPIIDNMPIGFTDILLEEFNLEIDLFNEIGIPVDISMVLEGESVNGNENISVSIEDTEIAYPYSINNHGCSFSNIRDTARTLIKLDDDSKLIEYYCNVTGDITYIEPFDTSIHIVDDTQSTILDLINAAPEKINVSASAKVEGEGIIYKGAEIWGNANLITPLSFIFSDSMTIIPVEYTSLASMDSSMVEQLNTSIIEVSLKTKVINASPLGGNVSILISDSTIFPLFIDSLITGAWTSQRTTFNTSIWEGSPPDSVYVTRYDGDHNNFNSRALEVIFFHYQPDTVSYFIGRLFDALEFSTTDSIDYELGYILPEFSETNEYIFNMYTKQIQWIVTVEPRNIVPIFTLYKSPNHPTHENVLSPLTLQTTNSVEVQSIMSILFSPSNLERKYY